MYVDALDVDDVIAHLLVTEGFSSVEEVAFVPVDDLMDIEGFDEEVAEELRERARNFLAQRDQALESRRAELGVEDDMISVEGITTAMAVKLGENDVKTRDDLADLAGDELMEIVGSAVANLDRANEIIMAARAHWFADEDAKVEETASDETAKEGETPDA